MTEIDWEEHGCERVTFASALTMAMMEKLGIRRMIDEEAKKHEKRLVNLSVGMAAKAFVGTMSCEMGRRPVRRIAPVLATAPKDRIFGPFVKPTGLNEKILRERLTTISQMDLPALHWNIYRQATEVYGLESMIFHIDSTDTDYWGAKYDEWDDGGAVPMHNNHAKSKRNQLLQKASHTVVDGNGVSAVTFSRDGNTSDIEMDRDSIAFLKERVDMEKALIVADCKLAVGETLASIIDLGSSFITKVPASFGGKIRDDIVYSATSGCMDESERFPGRRYYDTVADIEILPGRTERLRFVAFTLPYGKARAEEFLRTQGLSVFAKSMSNLGKFHCEDDARRAFDETVRGAYCGAYAADPVIRFDERLHKKDPDGPCWRAKGENPRLIESMLEKAAEEYAVSVLVTNLPFGEGGDILESATADDVISAYLGEYKVEHAFRLMKSGLNLGRMYIHSPARQDAVVFLTSINAMIRLIADNVLDPGPDTEDPYEDPEAEARHLTMKHIIDFMTDVYVNYDRENDRMFFDGAPGATEKVRTILERLDLDPKLLLGFRSPLAGHRTG